MVIPNEYSIQDLCHLSLSSFFVLSWINEILLLIQRIDTKKTGGGLDESLLQNPCITTNL